jgi:hypothetical protein
MYLRVSFDGVLVTPIWPGTKEYLQEDGVISSEGVEEQYAAIEKTDEGEYLISLVDA